jgi:hypothetical protein
VCKVSILRGFLLIVVRTGFYGQTMLVFFLKPTAALARALKIKD